jgi:hypothetical protein
MNTIKRFSIAGALILAVASSTIAGNIHTGVVAPPPPPPDEQRAAAAPQTAPAPSEIPIGFVPNNISTALILTLLLSVH